MKTIFLTTIEKPSGFLANLPRETIAPYARAVNAYLDTGDATVLQPFENGEALFHTSKGTAVFPETRPDVIRREVVKLAKKHNPTEDDFDGRHFWSIYHERK